MTTYSRTVVSAPTRTPERVPGLNLRSWGTPPSTLPWPIRALAPTWTRPSRTAWWPISTPASTVTSPPITAKAPMLTPGPSSARGSTSAVGWMEAAVATLFLRSLRLEVLVVDADDLVGEIGLVGGVEHPSPRPLHDQPVALRLAHAVDDGGQIGQNLLEETRLLLLEVLLEVVGDARGVPALLLELFLLLAADLRGHEGPLLLEFLAELLHVDPPGVHLLLHGGFLALQLLARGHTGLRARQHPLDVDEPDLLGGGRDRGRRRCRG